MSLGLSVANDIASAALKFYARGKAIAQTIQDKPLLGFLQSGAKTFPGGNQYVSDPVQGAYMASTAGFFAGISEDDELTFKQASNLLRAEYPWKEVHAGLIITWTELLKDGISIVEDQRTAEHSDVSLTRLTGILENRMDDYGESWARSMNTMLWGDGVADSKQVPGIAALFPENPAVATVGGLSQATYEWWRHYVQLGIVPSKENQTLTEALVATLIQLRKRGGKPNKAVCGRDFLAALRLEKREGLQYTQAGFAGKSTDLGDGGVKLAEVGDFVYDPTLDDMGLSKYCYVFDGRRLKLRPIEGEANKVITPERPYNYFVFLKSMTWKGAMQATQMNCHAIFSIA